MTLRISRVTLLTLIVAAAALHPHQLAAQDSTAAPGTGVWRNYDFVRGDSIWYASDFRDERVGRFPASQLEFVSGNMEIVERNGAKLLEAKSAAVVRIPLPTELPAQYSVEFRLEIGAANFFTSLYSSPHEGSNGRYATDYVHLYSRPGIYRGSAERSAATERSFVKNMVPIRLQVDGEYAILYVGSTRVGMVPNANFARSKTLQLSMNGQPGRETYLSDIVVAVGLDPLYETLLKTGEVTTYGLYFDVDSDRLRPESTPQLDALTKMLTDHADLTVAIEGHTDATGDDAHNQSLSERRAAAVVAYLTTNGIAAARLAAVGKGESVPVGDNGTALGRAQNRRVVIRKQ
ncbi:MAG: OmpA family protein [Gemmatimonadetes bacterium]|nr:OmpA family protein [Gemmatimonadota bacterium]MCC6773176.1 OmpA family protein [Gemmatimonadaceae bacterium]